MSFIKMSSFNSKDISESQNNLIQLLKYSVNVEYKDILSAITYFEEMDRLGAPLTIGKKIAIIDFVQGAIDADLSGKIIAFLPFLGNNDTFMINLFDPANLPTIQVLQENRVDEGGLIGNSCRISLPYTLGGISYQPDGQPAVGAGILFNNKTAWPEPPSTPWIVDGGNSEFNIDYWYSDNKSYVYIGGSAVVDGMEIVNNGEYWHAQRNGNFLQVYGDKGLINFLEDPTLENKHLRPETNGWIRLYNQLPEDYRTRAVWLVKALSDTEERKFNSLLTTLKSKLAQ